MILQAIFSRAKVTGCVTTDQTRPTVLKLIKRLKSNGYIRKFSPAALGLEATPLENPGYAPGRVVLFRVNVYFDETKRGVFECVEPVNTWGVTVQWGPSIVVYGSTAQASSQLNDLPAPDTHQ